MQRPGRGATICSVGVGLLASVYAWTLSHAGNLQAPHTLPLHLVGTPSLGDADLALVLAVDVSGSMSQAELRVQRDGYVAAFRHRDVATAIAAHTAVAVTYVDWAGPKDQSVVVPWTILRGSEDAEQFADRLAAAPLRAAFQSPPWLTGTSISAALRFAGELFSDVPALATRVIDISGNGVNNAGDRLDDARAAVLAAGITINGLPIVVPLPYKPEVAIEDYFEHCVIGGPGAFAIPVTNASELESSIRLKIVREIAGAPAVVQFAAAPVEAGTDCESIGY